MVTNCLFALLAGGPAVVVYALRDESVRRRIARVRRCIEAERVHHRSRMAQWRDELDGLLLKQHDIALQADAALARRGAK